MKVLIIGQLPTEVGGNYTTGMGKVVYELSKQKLNGIMTNVYATNIKDSKAKKMSTSEVAYAGYKFCLKSILFDILMFPLCFSKEWKFYYQKCHMNPLRCFFYKSNFRRVISEFNPDIIHVHSIKNVAPLFFSIKKENLVPIIATLHGVFYKGDSNDVIGRDLYLNNIPYINYVTGLTEEMRGEINNFFGVADGKISIIPNGVNSNYFYYSNSEREILRKCNNISDEECVFLTVGSVQNRKGQLSFLKHLIQMEFLWHYWIIGKGVDIPEIITFCKQHKIEDRVHIIGYVNNSQLYKYYSASDIYAHVSLIEGQALSEIEANSTGLPIIVNKTISRTVVGDIDDKLNYYILDFENVNYKQLESWCQYRRPTRKSNSIYDWKFIAKQYEDLYVNVYDLNVRK